MKYAVILLSAALITRATYASTDCFGDYNKAKSKVATKLESDQKEDEKILRGLQKNYTAIEAATKAAADLVPKATKEALIKLENMKVKYAKAIRNFEFAEKQIRENNLLGGGGSADSMLRSQKFDKLIDELERNGGPIGRHHANNIRKDKAQLEEIQNFAKTIKEDMDYGDAKKVLRSKSKHLKCMSRKVKIVNGVCTKKGQDPVPQIYRSGDFNFKVNSKPSVETCQTHAGADDEGREVKVCALVNFKSGEITQRTEIQQLHITDELIQKLALESLSESCEIEVTAILDLQNEVNVANTNLTPESKSRANKKLKENKKSGATKQ